MCFLTVQFFDYGHAHLVHTETCPRHRAGRPCRHVTETTLPDPGLASFLCRTCYNISPTRMTHQISLPYGLQRPRWSTTNLAIIMKGPNAEDVASVSQASIATMPWRRATLIDTTSTAVAPEECDSSLQATVITMPWRTARLLTISSRKARQEECTTSLPWASVDQNSIARWRNFSRKIAKGEPSDWSF